jgi:adenylate cyclase
MAISGGMSPDVLVAFLGTIFHRIDMLIAKYDLLKVKTIGDAVLVVGGIGQHHETDHALAVTRFALDVLSLLQQSPDIHDVSPVRAIHARASVNSGPVIAGVITEEKTMYDIFGETVNVASRMEKLSEADCVLISQATASLLPVDHGFELIPKGSLLLKGKSEPVTTYLIRSETCCPSSGSA